MLFLLLLNEDLLPLRQAAVLKGGLLFIPLAPMASLDLLLHHGAILKGRKSWMSCFQLRSVNLGSPGSLFLLAVLS